MSSISLYRVVLPYYQLLHGRFLAGTGFPVDPAHFDFNKHGAPFSDQKFVSIVIAAYVAMVFVHFQFRSVFKWISEAIPTLLQAVFIVHNIILSAGSLLLLALMLENLVPRIIDNGLMWALCHEDSFEMDHRLEFFYFVNYLFKFYELFDTLMLILKGKRLEFLHWYHHAATLFLCYTQLVGRTSISWVPIVLNLWVHVIMYYYYARTAISSRPVWWKKHLTTMQIIQFVLDLTFINLALYLIINHEYGAQISAYLGIPQPAQVTWGFLGKGVSPTSPISFSEPVKTCYGTVAAGFWGWSILSSYLLLFIQFFIATYQKKTRGKKYGGAEKDTAGKSKTN